MTIQPRVKPFATILAIAVFLVLGVQWIRPLPFSTTDDNWMYFLPLIKAHTDALLHGEPLKVLWSLGAGWVPWENAQVGVLYLPYHLANLIARLLGHPLALLEVSAWLHLSAAALVAYHFTPNDRPERERLAWGLVAMLVPGPLLLGLNWHNYLSCYPWFLALAFMLRRQVSQSAPSDSRAERLWLGLASLGFFLSAHAQMYVIGIGLLLFWAWAEAPGRSTLWKLIPFLWTQVPALVPLLYLKMLALGGTPDWMGDRDDAYYLLRHAQTIGGVIHGAVFGNLIYTRDFQLWANISWTGVGMFFSPALVLLSRPLWKGRNWWLGVFFLGTLVFMGAASFPWVRHLGVGPLEGFRWTWKICIFTGPLALVSLLLRLDKALPKRSAILPGLLALLSLGVFLRGLSFEIWPSLAAAHPIGAERLVEETRRMAQATGLTPGTRIALAGPFDMVQPLPLPVLGLVGNAAILSGLESVHIYEPMEPAWVSRGHYGLSLPWRVTLPATFLLDRPHEIFPALAAVGVQAVVLTDPKAKSLPGAKEYLDPLGRLLWVVTVPDAPSGLYPSSPGLRLNRQISGVLVAGPLETAPTSISVRPLSWHRGRDGYYGVPDSFPSGWAFASLASGVVCLLGLVFCRFARDSSCRDASVP